MRVLLIEEDVPLADFLRQRLQDDQFSVELAKDGEQGRRLLDSRPCDLAILDLPLPGVSGFGLLRQIRERTPYLPVLLLSGSGAIEDRVMALDAGADDYLAKPFSYAELLARLRALLRRGKSPPKLLLTVADLELDRVEHSVRRGNRSVSLTPKEFALLEFLMQHPGQPVTRSTITEKAWKLGGDTMTNIVDVYINYLRRKIDRNCDHRLIRTIRGVGYQIG